MLRKQLDHRTHFAGRFGAIYFITICCRQRGANQLCCEISAKVLFETAQIYHEHGRWNLNLLLLMPDHLHGLIGIDGRDSLSHLIRDYKRITARMMGVRWQRNFFDHRLRHNESLAEKFAYICQNPVRAGLVRNEEDWPYVFIPGRGRLASIGPSRTGFCRFRRMEMVGAIALNRPGRFG